MSNMPFGRRPSPLQTKPLRVEAAVEPLRQAAVVEPQPVAAFESTVADDDYDDRGRKEERRPFPIPWRQLYLMASLSFGIASFVLPDSVNDAVDWLLYILCGASLWAWYKSRPAKR